MKSLLAAGVSLAALALGMRWRTRSTPMPQRPARMKPRLPDGRMADPPTDAPRAALMYFVIPVWIAAGLADWACHCATDVEHTGGVPESLLHLLMMAEMGVPSLAGLFLEINAPVFVIMLGAFLAHEVTAFWDVRYATMLREVTPIEQHVHSFLELMPLLALALSAVSHPAQFASLFGFGEAAPDTGLRLKRAPLPKPYVVAVLAAIAAFNTLPFLEELWRCIRAEAKPAGPQLAEWPQPAT
jgi:hypothetical protein